MDYEIIEGHRKGAKVYVSDGYLYLKNNIYKGKINLRCQSHNSGCKGTGYIENGKVFVMQGHLHTEQKKLIEKLKIESKIKNESEKTAQAPRDIYNANVKSDLCEVIPFHKLSSTMRKRRATTFPAVPKDMVGFHEILNSTEFGKIDEELFYRCFSTANSEYAIIFVPEIDHAIFQKVEQVHADGTFKTVPKEFYQLVIIHCVILDTMVPCIFILMTSKSRLLYDAVFLSVRNLIPCLKPVQSKWN